MPKLTAKQAATIAKTEPAIGGRGSFEPLAPGKYLGRLAEVEATTSSNGNPMWSIQWDNIRDLEGNELPGRQFFNLNFPTSAKRPEGWGEGPEHSRKRGTPDERWANYQERCKQQIHGFFLAHGYTVDSDTDEMIGEDCVLDLVIRTQEKGKNAGVARNEVDGFGPVDEATAEAAGAGSDDEDDDEF